MRQSVFRRSITVLAAARAALRLGEVVIEVRCAAMGCRANLPRKRSPTIRRSAQAFGLASDSLVIVSSWRASAPGSLFYLQAGSFVAASSPSVVRGYRSGLRNLPAH